MNIDIVKNLNLDKKDQVEFVNFANFVMRFFEVKIIQAIQKKIQATIQVQYKLTSKKEQVERE